MDVTPTKKKITRDAALADSAAVDAFMANLDHPHKATIEAIRSAVRAADPRIVEGIKWNAPSFRTSEYFATTHLRAKIGTGLILHLGARVRDIASVPVDDPAGLLTWLARDRAMIAFISAGDVNARKSELRAIVRQWIACL
jgi:hypothetical protein